MILRFHVFINTNNSIKKNDFIFFIKTTNNDAVY